MGGDEDLHRPPPSKLNRGIGTQDESAPMSLFQLDFEGYELLDTNHVGLDSLPAEVLRRLKEFNRYKNILPNPETQVHIPRIGADSTTTFINANYIENWSGNTKGYIAAQGPKDTTIGSFWRMVWQEDVRAIVMTTGLMEGTKQKCARYWPQAVYNPATGEGAQLHGGVYVAVINGTPSRHVIMTCCPCLCSGKHHAVYARIRVSLI